VRHGSLLSAALVVALAACGGGSSDRPTAATGGDPTTDATDAPLLAVPELTRTGGCGDVFFFGVSADEAVGLVVTTNGPFTAGPDSVTRHFDLPSDALSVKVEVGSQVGMLYCNDTLTPEYHVDATREAIRGSVDITVDPGDCPRTGTAELNDVVIKSGGQEATVPDMTIRAEGIGCFAG